MQKKRKYQNNKIFLIIFDSKRENVKFEFNKNLFSNELLLSIFQLINVGLMDVITRSMIEATTTKTTYILSEKKVASC